MIGPVIVSLEGTRISDRERQLLAHPKVGGVVLFRENWERDNKNAKEALKILISEIRSINPNLIIMVDHEGGKVWRFEQGFTKLPSAKTFGDRYDKNREEALTFAFQQGQLMATELLECGVDISLAPVLDLHGISNVIGKLERAFHANPKVVAELAEQFIRGMNEAGMPATAKHFPGHGSCAQDSHVASPVDSRTLKELENDLYPFKALVERNLLGAVMPAHVTYPAVDPLNTAGFSSIWIQNYLRAWGFNGVVMSDCLSMAGAGSGSPLERLEAAQKAGCDFLMLTHQKGPLLETLMGILDRISDTKESAERRTNLAKCTAENGVKVVKVTTAHIVRQVIPDDNPVKIAMDYLYQARSLRVQKGVAEQIERGLSHGPGANVAAAPRSTPAPAAASAPR